LHFLDPAMPPCGRRRPTVVGAWVPSGLPGEGGGSSSWAGRQGPDNLDVECKASLQKLLKPSNYAAIDVWMRSHGTKDKKGILLLAEAAVGDNGVPVQQDKAYAASRQPVQLNPKGRHRVATSVHVTADRQQADLLKVKSGEEQRDKDLLRRRKFLQDYAPMPSTESVSDYYRLSDVPVAAEPGAKVLTEDARRGLARWQIRGPEQNREQTAHICQALRSLGDSVNACPTYTDNLRASRSGGHGCTERLVDHGAVKQLHRSGNFIRRLPMTQPGQGLSRSMPSIPPAYLDRETIENIKRPGGYVVNLMDNEPLQMMKNKRRSCTTKMVQGGSTSYTTSYNAMFANPDP